MKALNKALIFAALAILTATGSNGCSQTGHLERGDRLSASSDYDRAAGEYELAMRDAPDPTQI